MNTDTRLEQLGDRLERAAAADVRREQSTATPGATRARTGFLRRPRVLAGSSLGLAAVGAAVLLVLSGTAATPPAYAITQNGDGTVLLKINFGGRNTLSAADATLMEKYHEVANFYTASPSNDPTSGDLAAGPSTNSAPIACTPIGNPKPSGPQVKILVGTDNTFVIPSGTTGGGGTMHLVSCQTYVDDPGSNSGSGNSGAGSSGNTGGSTAAPGTLTAQPRPATGAGSTGNTGG